MKKIRDDKNDYAVFSSLMIYEPTTGNLVWRYRPGNERFNAKHSGEVTGVRFYDKSSKKYYKRVTISGVCKSAVSHRICFLLMTGRWPVVIDHIDGDGENNKWENIREVSRSENNKNRVLGGRSKTGLHGVHIRNGNYRVIGSIDGKTLSLGTYKNIFDAACARKSFERKNGYHENHGAKPIKLRRVLSEPHVRAIGIRIKGEGV